ncbi:MAG TPA: hypothetical protein PKI11_21250, partial [Candidatus Hydrogenedentes bacterium]|nr:hypothetical protein [Candidatus Hydrogenedentota bacterium]
PFIYPDNVGYSGNYNVTVTLQPIGTLPSPDDLRTSQSAAILVQPEVSFSTAPQNETKNVTDSVTFTAEATGGYPFTTGDPYTYAWTWNGNLLVNGNHPSGSGSQVSGAGTTSITVTGLRLADAGTYAVVANDAKAPCPGPTPGHQNKCTATASATLTMTNHVTIVDQPDDLDVYHGDNVSFSVTADGGDPGSYSYEWYWNNGVFETLLEDGNHPSGTGATVSGATSATLQLGGVRVGATAQTSDAGEYRAIVRDTVPANNAGESLPATLGVYAAVSVTTHPASANRYDGESVSFSVVATGGLRGERSYLWEVSTDGGGSWSPLSNGGVVSGATSTTLTLASVALADDANRYRCQVTSLPSEVGGSPSSNWEATSNSATLRVSDALVILDRPADVQAYVSEPPFQLRVHFEGGMPPYSSMWRRAGVNPVVAEQNAGPGTIILGSPNTTVLTVSPTALGAGLYTFAAQLTDQVKMTRSDTGTVEIANDLQFIRGLENKFVRLRQRFEWSVEVAGGLGTVRFQWYKDDGTKAFVPLADDALHTGTQTTEMTFVEIAQEDEGLYQVVVSDDFTSIESQAQLTVGTALPVAGLAGVAALALASALAGAGALRRRRRC